MQGKSVSSLPFNLTPKAVLAFLFPLLAALAAALVTWITDGTFDVGPIRLAAAGLVASGLALLGAYVGRPAQVVEPAYERAELHDAPGA